MPLCQCHVHLPGSPRVAPARRTHRRLSPELPWHRLCAVLGACSWWLREGYLKRIDTTVGILQSNSRPNPNLTVRDVEKQSGLLSYLETEGGGGHCWGWKQFLLTPSPLGFLLGSLQGGRGQPTGSRSSRRIWLGSRGAQLGYTRWLGRESYKQRP